MYKVSTSVEQEVFKAIDLRVDIENKESNKISSTTEVDTEKRIAVAIKEIGDLEKNASTTDLINDAQKSLETAQKYLDAKDFENAIISLQSHDRIVADLKIILVP